MSEAISGAGYDAARSFPDVAPLIRATCLQGPAMDTAAVRKYRGQVVGLDMVNLKAMIDESPSHLFKTVGYRPDVFAELLPKLS
jgi:hypothetical protein